eukprot:Gregarina_sp_Poly_1__2292@NODE_1610_length_3717_cov_281_889863_g1061_i0_p2_GENE_NODE_1610_length_3717_cov_281_889863_g1061_i0NODE_1610_length_3717_cov_281_889863_g1061_i0_p2_ORF_typecomplete_len126_score5_15_NODE_1610_length_3717_cov_281_889863_g1061_i014521829
MMNPGSTDIQTPITDEGGCEWDPNSAKAQVIAWSCPHVQVRVARAGFIARIASCQPYHAKSVILNELRRNKRRYLLDMNHSIQFDPSTSSTISLKTSKPSKISVVVSEIKGDTVSLISFALRSWI